MLSAEISNDMDTPVLLVYTSPNDNLNDTTNERVLQPHETMHTVFTVQATEAPPPFTFKAFSTDMKEQLVINGQPEVSAAPSSSYNRPMLLEINSASAKLYYVNLYVLNKAGQKVTVQVVWDERVGPETLEIDEGEAKNISKSIATSPNQLPNYEFQIHEYGSNKNLLINGHPSYTLTPNEDSHAVTMIEITPSPESDGGKPVGQGIV
jgi:hypothetical protein